MRRGEPSRRRALGFTYIGLLALVVLIGILLAAAGEVTQTALQREREDELLWVGRQYRAAIGRYVAHFHRLPKALAELTGPTAGTDDPMAAGAQDPLVFRAMRRLYPDPMTRAADWTPIEAPDGSIMGVASTSSREPLKIASFEDGEEEFPAAKAYADWQFVFQPLGRRKPQSTTPARSP